jgi:hypothetical protein
MISISLWSILNVIRQFFVTKRLHVPLRAPVSRCALQARHVPQFIFFIHLLEKGDHASNFANDGELKAAHVIVFDEAPQSLMDHVSDPHGHAYGGWLFGVK